MDILARWIRTLLCCFLAPGLAISAEPTIVSIVNTASSLPAVSPGGLATIFGAEFGTTPSEVSVSINGLNAPVLFASNHQVNVQFPFELSSGPAAVTVTVEGRASLPAQVWISPYSPALFSSSGLGVLTNSSGTLIGAAAPGQIINVYATGLGPVNPPVNAGNQTSAGILSACVTKPAVTVGGIDALVQSAGLAAGLTGVYQVGFVVPDVGLGNRDLVVSLGGVKSQTVTIQIANNESTAVLPDTGGLIRLPADESSTPSAPTDRASVRETFAAVHSIKARAAGEGGRSAPVILSEPLTGGNPELRPRAAPGQNPITYICDPSITNLAGDICTLLNTSTAGLYSRYFANAGANIYITFGSTGLGQSVTPLSLVSYGNFRNALMAAETDSNDQTAVADSVPPTSPFGNDSVAITNATARALGFQAASGIQANGASCATGASGCYDGLITISSNVEALGEFYFRSGIIRSNQYDFLTVVEHETDEVLGTASCAFGCDFGGTLAITPADLFRYHSNRTRSFAAGTNDSCSAGSTQNACFSIDGVHMLQQFNNLNNGEDAGDWVPNCAAQLVQNSELCPGIPGIDISPTAEVELLDVVGFGLYSSLTITKTHAGNFTQGQSGVYTVIVSNAAGAAFTSGLVTVSETIPSGLTRVSMSGTGWTCAANNCSRSDSLSGGASYPPITVTVNVSSTAASPQVNLVQVSGGGCGCYPFTSDSTTITASSGGGSGSDLALHQAATQSSTYQPGFTDASKAVDGNTDGNFWDGSVSHTNQDANAWWEVDLGASANVSSIVVWNRTDCCGDRLSDYWVFVSDTPFAPTDTPATLQSRAGTYSSHQTVQPSPSSTISIAGAQGRYVRVQLSGTNYLSLAEVQVYGTLSGPAPQDLAVNKAASQSSTLYPSTAASKAVDGNTDGNFWDGSVSHTNQDANAWWEVDLGASATVSSIVVWNRTDCCGDRLSDYWVFVSNTPFLPTDTPTTLQSRAGTWSSHQTAQPSPSASITVPSAQGRYVRVQLSGSNYLSLAEVQVFGTLTGPAPQDVAVNKAATQSSTYQPGFTGASKAVDGNTDGIYADGSLTHTNLDANAWWEVDLGASVTVSSIGIWNRTDCCGSRLSDYWVFVSNTPFLPTDTPTTLQNRAGTYSSHQTTQPNPSASIAVPSAQGRYVRVQLSGTNYLSLAEVQVFGQ